MREIARYRVELEMTTYEEARALVVLTGLAGYRSYTISALDADGVPLYTPDDEAQEEPE